MSDTPNLPYDETQYRNNGTVVCVLLPFLNGLAVIRRAGDEGYGKLGIPGGFQEYGEPWRLAGAREIEEEIGIIIDPTKILLYDYETDEWNHNVVFGLYSEKLPSDTVFVINPKEVLEMVFITEPVETAFPFHTETIRKFFHQFYGKVI